MSSSRNVRYRQRAIDAYNGRQLESHETGDPSEEDTLKPNEGERRELYIKKIPEGDDPANEEQWVRYQVRMPSMDMQWLSFLLYGALAALLVAGLAGALYGVVQVRNPHRDLTPEDFDRWRNLTAPSGRSKSLAPVKSPSADDERFVFRIFDAPLGICTASRCKFLLR